MTDPILSGIYPNLRAIFGMINILELSENPGKEIQSFLQMYSSVEKHVSSWNRL